MAESNEVSQVADLTRGEVFATIVSEANAVYRLIVTVATSFLGGTLLFLEKIAPAPTKWSLWLLLLGWVSLIAAIVLVVFIRRCNIQSGQFFLENKIDDARELDRKKWHMMIWATWLLAGGIFMIMLFGFTNLYAKDSKMADEPKQTQRKVIDPKQVEERSIPFGSLRPGTSGSQNTSSQNQTSNSNSKK